MQRPRRILWEGMVTGLIGAVSVAVWFLIVDGAAGRPFYTPRRARFGRDPRAA